MEHNFGPQSYRQNAKLHVADDHTRNELNNCQLKHDKLPPLRVWSKSLTPINFSGKWQCNLKIIKNTDTVKIKD